MKLPLLERVQQALNTRKKNGDPVFDQDNLEVCVAGTFAGDKFIVIKTPTPRVESTPDPELKPHHPINPCEANQEQMATVSSCL